MLIRCDKCSTLYELEEDLLPPRGAPVQCSKCQFVFTAYPAPCTESPHGGSDDAAPSPLPAPSGDPPDSFPLHAEAPDSFPLHEEMEPEAACSAPPVETQFTADGRPIRKVPFPKVEDPAHAGQRPGIARAAGRVSSLSGFPRQKALLWIVPLAVLAFLVIAIVAWRMFGHRVDPPVTQQREGQALPDDRAEHAPAAAVDDAARLDDGGSLEPTAPGAKKRAR